MPEIKPVKELRFRSPNGRLNLRASLLRPGTNSDFVSTQGIVKRDVAFFPVGPRATGAGLGEDTFYIGGTVARDFQLGNSLYISGSAGKDVIIVHLDGPTTVIS